MKNKKVFFANLHLDFHTPDYVESLGTCYDAERLLYEVKQQGFDSITFCAKDHHGNSYYFTNVGHRHPHLHVDMLQETVKAAHRYGLKIIAYYSVIWDEWIARQYPEWIQVDVEGNRLTAKVEDFSQRWSFLCLNSPYIQEVLWPQLKEIMTEYDIDGLFLDVLRYHHNACKCQYCQRKFGSLLSTPDGQKLARTKTVMEFVKNTTAWARRVRPEIHITYNSIQTIGMAYQLRHAVDYFVVEALPDEGGYLFPSALARYLRNMRRPIEAMVVTFHRSWGDFGSIKHIHQLQYELATMVANGCNRISLGDHLLPTGKLEEYRFRIYAAINQFFRQRMEWSTKCESVKEVGVLVPEDLDSASPSVQFTNEALAGVSQFLIEEHYQFDIFDQQMVAEHFIDLEQYQLILLPDCSPLHSHVVKLLKRYVQNGGIVLGTYRTALHLSELLGVAFDSWSPFEHNYLHFPRLLPGVPAADVVVYSTLAQVTLQSKEVEVISWLRYPMGPRTTESFYGHRQAPPGQITSFPAVVINKYGEGIALYIAAPLFADYYRNGCPLHRGILRACLRRIYPKRKIQVFAPGAVEVVITQQPRKQCLLVHLINFHTAQRGHRPLEPITELPVWKNICISADLQNIGMQGSIKRVFAIPSSTPLEWQIKESKLKILIPKFKGIYAIVVIECNTERRTA